jgi:S-(hydroxymethyl)glutathione dehydrogenase/alcohol dehydrogenase
VITHEMKLDDAPNGYKIFNDKVDDCEKIVLKPH